MKIGHDLIGGSIIGSASLDRSGNIESTAGRIGIVTLGGSILSGIRHQQRHAHLKRQHPRRR